MTPLRFLMFDVSDNDEGVVTIKALASTSARDHDAVMAETRQVLDWARTAFPHTHGPVDDGGEWDHDLQAGIDADGWHAVTLTLTGTAEFASAFAAAFAPLHD